MTPSEFRALREAAGLTPSQAGRLLGVHRGTIWNWESGRSPIPFAAGALLKTLVEHGKAHPVEAAS